MWRLVSVWRMLAARACAAEVEARIDLSEQTMTVFVDGAAAHTWPVSTARPGKFTPTGMFTVQSMRPMHYSTLYNNAPMPWSIFFWGNFAIHGTTQVDRLGQPASAGCVRLHPDDAKTLYQLIKENGRTNAFIAITE